MNGDEAIDKIAARARRDLKSNDDKLILEAGVTLAKQVIGDLSRIAYALERMNEHLSNIEMNVRPR